MAGAVTFKEISEQFDLWRGLIEDMELLQQDVSVNFAVREFDGVIFVGAGSSYHIATSAASAFRTFTGEPAVALPSSEVAIFHNYHLKKSMKYIVVFFSRSGITTETLEALNVLKSNYRITSIAISCDPLSALCKECDMMFPVKNCFEESHIMTKSFTGMLFLSYMFSAAFGDRFSSLSFLEQLPDEGRSSFEWQRRIMDQVASEVSMDRITVLGGGPFVGIARESALKLDEVAALRTKTCEPLELRHGPHLAIGKDDFVILLHSSTARDIEMALLVDIKARGAKTLVLSEKKEPAFDAVADYRILTGRGFPEHCRGILYAPFIQHLACRVAISKNIDPDNIPGMTRVVTY